MKCAMYIRTKSYANAVLSSGMTMFQWIFEHMTKELTALAPSTMKLICGWSTRVEILGMDLRIHRVFPQYFQPRWISKGGYDEPDPSIVPQ